MSTRHSTQVVPSQTGVESLQGAQLSPQWSLLTHCWQVLCESQY
jgi:hypothetical protein